MVALVVPLAPNLLVAARTLGLHPDTISVRIETLGLARPKPRKHGVMRAVPVEVTAFCRAAEPALDIPASADWPDVSAMKRALMLLVLAHAPNIFTAAQVLGITWGTLYQQIQWRGLVRPLMDKFSALLPAPAVVGALCRVTDPPPPLHPLFLFGPDLARLMTTTATAQSARIRHR